MMLRHLFTSFLSILFLSTSWADSSVLSNDKLFAINKHSYRDIRIDSNSDGKVDLWYVRNNNIEIKRYLQPTEEHVHIRNLDYPRNNILISIKNGHRKISKWKEDLPRLYNFTTDICNDDKNSISNLLQVKDDVNNFIIDEVIVNLVDSSCDNILTEGSHPHLQESLAMLLSSDKHSLQSCLDTPSLLLPLAKINNDMALISAQAKLNAQEYMKNPDEIQPLIFCEPGNTNEDGGKFSKGSASYQDGRILLKSNGKGKISFRDQDETNKVLFHEYLHHLGIETEDHAQIITDKCTTGSQSERMGGAVVAGNQSLAQASANKAQEIIAANNQGISKAAAETVKAIPSSPSAAPAHMAQIHKAAGYSGVEAVSRSQTSGVLASANNLMGLLGTRASAAAKPTGSSARSPSSTGKATKFKSDSLVTTKRTKSKAGKAQAGETMVEEYVLGQGTSTSKRAAAANRVASSTSESAARQSTNSTGDQPTVAPTASTAAPRRRGGTETARSNAGGGGGAGISSLPNSSGSASRRPANASTGSGSSGSSESTTTEEYVTYFTQNSYSEVKQKLRDAEFVEKLREASVTVLDLRGTVYGAEKGNVILLDRGDRFVPQR